MSRTAKETLNVTLDGRDVRLTSLERVLWPDAGLTKGWLLRSYLALAPVLLPHLRGHPITMWRYPEGIARPGWWQNECRGAPPWVSVYGYTGADGRGHRHCVIDDVSSLMWLVNLGTVEIHPFPFSTERDDAPSWLVFDLDPGEPAGLQEACQVAATLHDVLIGQGVESFPKTSGAKGIHVFVPLHGSATFPEAKAYGRTVAAYLASEAPHLVVKRQARALRSGKVLIDWLQNDRFRSTVAPYSLRATPTPNVSTPLDWAEVRAVADGSADEAALSFDVGEVLARVERDGDLFAPVLTMTQSLQA
jgi:bifunctional non-homologous end joining protein LigD